MIVTLRRPTRARELSLPAVVFATVLVAAFPTWAACQPDTESASSSICPATAPAPGSYLASADSQKLTRALAYARSAAAQRDLAAAQVESAATSIEIYRGLAEEVADDADFLSETLESVYGVRDLQMPDKPSPEIRKLFQALRPTQDFLEKELSTPSERRLALGLKRVELLSATHDLLDAIRQDLADTEAGRPFVGVSSHTEQAIGRVGLGLILDADRLKQLVNAGKISAQFGAVATVVNLGAADTVDAIATVSSTHNWQDPEMLSHLLDGFAKSMWGTIAYRLTGSLEIANVAGNLAGIVTEGGRRLSLGLFVDAVNGTQGIDERLVHMYRVTQLARVAQGQQAQSIEAFYGFDREILHTISASRQRTANAEFHVTPPPSSSPIFIVTHTEHVAYSEVCVSGVCRRDYFTPGIPRRPSASPIAASPLIASSANLSGVLVDPQPARVGAPPASIADKTLAACGRASDIVCSIH